MQIKNRSLLFVFLMSIFTIGIYIIYWAVKTKNEIKSLGADIPTALLVVVPFAHFYFWYKYSQGFVTVIEKQPENNSLTILYFIALQFVPIAGMLIVQEKLNKLSQDS